MRDVREVKQVRERAVSTAVLAIAAGQAALFDAQNSTLTRVSALQCPAKRLVDTVGFGAGGLSARVSGGTDVARAPSLPGR